MSAEQSEIDDILKKLINRCQNDPWVYAANNLFSLSFAGNKTQKHCHIVIVHTRGILLNNDDLLYFRINEIDILGNVKYCPVDGNLLSQLFNTIKEKFRDESNSKKNESLNIVKSHLK